MSNHADHDAAHGHAPQRPEVTHPLLWTVGLLIGVMIFATTFYQLFRVGQQHAKGEPKIVLAKAGEGEPDHRKLMADNGQAVVDKGEILYGKNCASCHGATGDTNPSNINPTPRNFKKDAFKNANGGGPWGFYSVLSEGYGAGMPAFRNLSPADRWAVVHFVREAWMKTGNPAFVAKDKADVEAKIPAPGAAGGATADVDPRMVAEPELLHPLMAGWSAGANKGRDEVQDWIRRAADSADAAQAPLFARLGVLASTQSGRGARLRAAVAQGDRDLALAVLIREDGAGSADPVFSLASASTINAVWDRLRATPFASGAVK